MADPAHGSTTAALDGVAPSSPRDRLGRILPFVAALGLALGLAALPPGQPGGALLLAGAASGFVACAATIVAVPWTRVPSPLRLAPVALFCTSVALVREATSAPGARSGFAVLLLFAVVWQAIYGRRSELVVTGIMVFATAAVPIVVVGAPEYPLSEWRNAAVLTFTAVVIGLVLQRLVRDLRRERALVTTVARIGRTGAAAGDDPRRSLCQAAVELTGARTALLLEPDGDGLRVSEAAGVDLTTTEVPGPLLEAAARAGWDLAQAGADGGPPEPHPAAPPGHREVDQGAGALGLQGWVHQPVVRDGRVQVVLSVGWEHPPRRTGARVQAALELLAAEAAAAIDRAELLARLERAARHDSLTGLVNRRAWDDHLVRAVARSARTGRPLAVAILDLDHFKAFNDLYGHLIGDQLLKAAAGAWLDTLRVGDVLCRWGGEEFAVLMPDTPADEARRALLRLAEATPMGQTLSAGFVTHVGAVDAEALMTGADQAVYRAKRNGRDRIEEGRPAPHVTVAEPIPLDPRG